MYRHGVLCIVMELHVSSWSFVYRHGVVCIVMEVCVCVVSINLDDGASPDGGG